MLEAVAGQPFRIKAVASSQPTILVLDASGATVASGSMSSVSGDLYQFDVTLPEGVYTVRIEAAGRVDVAQLFSRPSTHYEVSDFVRRLLSGTKKIVGTKLIIYDEDGVTPLISWDLKDASGAPVSQNPMEAIRA